MSGAFKLWEAKYKVSQAQISIISVYSRYTASTSTESPPRAQSVHDISETDDLVDDDEGFDETDHDRRQMLLSSEENEDWQQDMKSGTLWETIESNWKPESLGCDLPVSSGSVGTSRNPALRLPKGKRKRSEDDIPQSQLLSCYHHVSY